MISTAAAALPSRATGRPWRKVSTWRSAARGSRNALRVSIQASSGMLPAEVRVSLPPMVTPHRPRLTEYFAPVGGMGSRRCSR